MKKIVLAIALLFCAAFISAAQQEIVPLLSDYAELAENECFVCFNPMEGDFVNVVIAPCHEKSKLHGLCNMCLESVIIQQRSLKNFKGLKCSQCTRPYRNQNKKNIERLVAGKPCALNLFAPSEKGALSNYFLCCCRRTEG